MNKQGEISIKLRDVAKAAGVSQGTASNVFNRPEVVRQEVRERVHAVAKELGYAGPSAAGRLLRAGKVNAIGVATYESLTYFFDDPWARAVLSEISAVCDTRGAGIALVSAQNQQKVAWNIDSALVDGFIVLCMERGEQLLQLTRNRQLPYVALALDIDAADDSVTAIAVDNRGGALLAARHVAGLGHRRVAILALEFSKGHVGLTSPEAAAASIYSTDRERMYGYWQGLEEAGIGREAVPIYETRNTKANVDACMAELFAGDAPPTAIIGMSDQVALFAMQWLRQHDIAVPQQVSVIGFDGVPEAALSLPGLTTIEQPLAELAQRAVAAILDDDASGGRQTLALNLVVRGSTGPAPR